MWSRGHVVITSRQNPLVARFRDAAQDADACVVLLDGAHLLAEALDSGIAIKEIVVSPAAAENDEVRELLTRAEASGAAIAAATSAVVAAASPVRSSSGIVALAARPQVDPASLFKGPSTLIAVACGVQDPGNVGAIVRTADAAGATGFIAAGASAHPFGWKALRGSMGSALRLPIIRSESERAALELVKAHGCRIAAAVPHGGRPLFDTPLDGPLAVVVGSEGAGLSPAAADLADILVTIPMAPRVDSLNTAVSAALLLYEAARRRR